MNKSAFLDTSKVENRFPELNEMMLPAPALNISRTGVYGYNWDDPRGQDPHPFQDSEQQRYVYSGELYNMNDIKRNGQCQPLSTEVRAFSTSRLTDPPFKGRIIAPLTHRQSRNTDGASPSFSSLLC